MVVLRWWEWLARILLTLFVMASVALAVAIPLWLAYAPSTVSDSNWHSEVIVPLQRAFCIGAGVSVIVGVVVWRHYPPRLRLRESTGGNKTRPTG